MTVSKTFKSVAATAVLAGVMSLSLTACETTGSHGAKTQANGCSSKHGCNGKHSCKSGNGCKDRNSCKSDNSCK